VSLPHTRRKCSAHNRHSKLPCQNPAIRGGTVCRMHGGSAPHVKENARERLAALVDPAITRMGTLIGHKQPGIGLAAAKDILDRNGFKPTEKVQNETQMTIVVEYQGAPAQPRLNGTNGQH
jgi:hypothetical protein